MAYMNKNAELKNGYNAYFAARKWGVALCKATMESIGCQSLGKPDHRTCLRMQSI